MKIMPSVGKIIWKTPVVIVALLASGVGASQAGWNGAELIVSGPYMGLFEGFITGLFCCIGTAVSFGAFLLVQRIAKPVLWLMAPIFLYSVLVSGAWNGFASDFDATRGEAIKHHAANAYALEHMSQRGRYLSCKDERIDLTDDAQAVCARALNVSTGERIPGSEHRCGPLGIFGCFNRAPQNQKSDR